MTTHSPINGGGDNDDGDESSLMIVAWLNLW